MIKGYFDKQMGGRRETIYLIDDVTRKCITFSFQEHEYKEELNPPGTEFADWKGEKGLLKGIAEALQQGGYIPSAANDAELKATKYHLEDMRNLVTKTVEELQKNSEWK